ncbi:MAG: hypothetical protein HC921_17745 [Synechococcaceae cyanobacterium SM2_3_1]|nr:hypothetical protein [Synechococcaceae cyanobacterium SM2_3_1]
MISATAISQFGSANGSGMLALTQSGTTVTGSGNITFIFPGADPFTLSGAINGTASRNTLSFSLPGQAPCGNFSGTATLNGNNLSGSGSTFCGSQVGTINVTFSGSR